MMNKIMKKYRTSVFPDIQDWTSSQDHIRKSRNVKKLKWSEWFFLRPENYQIMYYGGNILSLMALTYFGVSRLVKGVVTPFTAIIFFILLMIIFNTIKKIRRHDEIKHTTLYDLWFRDYTGDVDENKM